MEYIIIKKRKIHEYNRKYETWYYVVLKNRVLRFLDFLAPSYRQFSTLGEAREVKDFLNKNLKNKNCGEVT